MLREVCRSGHLHSCQILQSSSKNLFRAFAVSTGSSIVLSKGGNKQDDRAVRKGNMDRAAYRNKKKNATSHQAKDLAGVRATSMCSQCSKSFDNVNLLHRHLKVNSSCMLMKGKNVIPLTTEDGQARPPIFRGKPAPTFLPATSLTKGWIPIIKLNEGKGKEREKDVETENEANFVSTDGSARDFATSLSSEAPSMHRSSSEGTSASNVSKRKSNNRKLARKEASLPVSQSESEKPSLQLEANEDPQESLSDANKLHIRAASPASSTEDVLYQASPKAVRKYAGVARYQDGASLLPSKSPHARQTRQTLFDKPVTGINILHSRLDPLAKPPASMSLENEMDLLSSAPSASTLPIPSFEDRQTAVPASGRADLAVKKRIPASPMVWGSAARSADPPTLGSQSMVEASFPINDLEAAIAKASFSVDKQTIVHQLATRLQEGAPFPHQLGPVSPVGTPVGGNLLPLASQDLLPQSTTPPLQLWSDENGRHDEMIAHTASNTRPSDFETQPARLQDGQLPRKAVYLRQNDGSASQASLPIHVNGRTSARPGFTAKDADDGSLSDGSSTSHIIRAVTCDLAQMSWDDPDKSDVGSKDVKAARMQLGRAILALDQVSLLL